MKPYFFLPSILCHACRQLSLNYLNAKKYYFKTLILFATHLCGIPYSIYPIYLKNLIAEWPIICMVLYHIESILAAHYTACIFSHKAQKLWKMRWFYWNKHSTMVLKASENTLNVGWEQKHCSVSFGAAWIGHISQGISWVLQQWPCCSWPSERCYSLRCGFCGIYYHDGKLSSTLTLQ